MWLGKVLSSPMPEERVVLYLRRHWFPFLVEIIRYVLLLIVPLLFAWVIREYVPDRWDYLFDGTMKEVVIKLALSVYYFGVWIFFWTSWVDYYLDVWLVTNERIISIEQRGLFNRSRSELMLGKIEDVTAEVKGVFATLLHFGNITVQTAGMEQNTILKHIHDPYQINDRILKLADNWRKEHAHNHANDSRN